VADLTSEVMDLLPYVVDLMFEMADLNLKVPDLRSAEIRLTLPLSVRPVRPLTWHVCDVQFTSLCRPDTRQTLQDAMLHYAEGCKVSLRRSGEAGPV